MITKLLSYGLSGLEAVPVVIEVDVTKGLPAVTIVGLPDNAVKESKERIRSAIKNSGFKFPADRITINLSPADTKKEGPAFDLAMALGILAATEQIPMSNLTQWIILGELSLDGTVQSINGSLIIALSAGTPDRQSLILPLANAVEAHAANRLPIYPVANLAQATQILCGDVAEFRFRPPAAQAESPIAAAPEFDFADIKGQQHVKRGLEIAAAGGHNVLLIGPPGSGKTMLAQRIPFILPDLTRAEALEITKIHSAVGLVNPATGLITRRPFRNPHHSASDVALIGGGSTPKPGEVTLAHHGVLFLDELPEFHRDALEALRQPLEDHHVTIARAAKTLRFPSQFMLVATMNPCPCGWLTDPKRSCHCSSIQIQRYLSKISGPLLDRIDLHLEVPSLPPQTLMTTDRAESSSSIKARVSATRCKQQERYAAANLSCNAVLNHRQLKTYCALNEDSKKLLRQAIEQLKLSARAYDKILKVSRTIADLAGRENLEASDVAEAIQYRFLDRNWW